MKRYVGSSSGNVKSSREQSNNCKQQVHQQTEQEESHCAADENRPNRRFIRERLFGLGYRFRFGRGAGYRALRDGVLNRREE